MEDPFILEARSHWAQASRNGRLAWQTFLATIASFAIFTWHVNDGGWWWLFFFGSIAFGVRMLCALEARWFHRCAARIMAASYDYLQRFG